MEEKDEAKKVSALNDVEIKHNGGGGWYKKGLIVTAPLLHLFLVLRLSPCISTPWHREQAQKFIDWLDTAE